MAKRLCFESRVVLMLSPDFRFMLRAISGVVLSLWTFQTAHAQAVKTPPLALRSSSELEENLTRIVRDDLPTFLESNRLQEDASFQTSLDGQVVIRRGDLLLKADHVEYDQNDDLVKARGNVYINLREQFTRGPH